MYLSPPYMSGSVEHVHSSRTGTSWQSAGLQTNRALCHKKLELSIFLLVAGPCKKILSHHHSKVEFIEINITPKWHFSLFELKLIASVSVLLFATYLLNEIFLSRCSSNNSWLEWTRLFKIFLPLRHAHLPCFPWQ